MKTKYVLAMYDIRGKQEYIYRSNRIKEIVGASAVIRDCFRDYLYPAAKEYRNQAGGCKSEEEAVYFTEEQKNEFSVSEFENRMAGGQYLGETVYFGGGNFFILYRDKETCIEINKRFTKRLRINTYSLQVLCSFIEGVDFSDYPKDWKRLYEIHERREARKNSFIPAQVLPFTQVDRRTSLPLYKWMDINRNELKREKVSKENYRKYEKYWEINGDEIYGEKLLDNLVTEKGEESLLAIIYIDGNNMGAQVQACLNGTDQSYESCIKQLRDFSAGIQKNYITGRMEEIDRKLQEKYGEKEEKNKRRFVIFAGDEITMICNARDAYDMVKTYFSNLPEGCSACAGVAIFHSHAPFSAAYQVAEECCESGKRKMKEEQLTDADFLDFHYCMGGIGIDLETVREKEVGTLISKPWLISFKKENPGYVTLEMVEALAKELHKISRSNVKGLAEAAKSGLVKLRLELARIKAHSSEAIDFTLNGSLDEEQMRSMLFDIVQVYDLWFAEEKKAGGNTHE